MRFLMHKNGIYDSFNDFYIISFILFTRANAQSNPFICNVLILCSSSLTNDDERYFAKENYDWYLFRKDSYFYNNEYPCIYKRIHI